MADTDNVASETVASETLKNDAPAPVETTQATPTKEENQTIMRLAQEKKDLEAKLATKERAEADARQKQLEEKEEFKTLFEQTKAELNAIKEANLAAERKAELSKATETVFADYPSNVVEIAKTAGLALSDDSDEAVRALKEKLDAFKAKVGAPTASANNPRPQIENAGKEELLQRMRGGDKTAVSAYIRDLPAIKRMKEIAQNGA